ncbi:DUF5008 domain-containing protein [Niabella yanshanensis]|uniref:DUF5008 domain-containing protein n=1 Tax=Niabella yanshanensis TaxID=577386 RepID=A0ABZ0WC55_9BACT|nr:DUF5008 domain-containing protein [Niabella yanshanensis]WQD39855.1 DUF5008 domain-containing protein [Niabella yanshanensis]
MVNSNQYGRSCIGLLVITVCTMFVLSCQKTNFSTTDIYQPNAKVDISFGTDAPQPSVVSEGTIVKYGISGLKAVPQGRYKFYINQMEAGIQEVTDTYISVRVPVNASSGSASVVFDDGQIYYGPGITVRGNTQIADDFLAGIGSNKALSNGSPSFASINGITARPDGNYLIYGNFDEYGNTIVATNITKNIQVIDNTGKALAAESQFVMGKLGLNGAVNDIKILDNGMYLVSGNFSTYDTMSNVNGVARFLTNRTLDFSNYEVANPDPETKPQNSFKAGSAINGGNPGGVLNTYEDTDGKYITVGNYNTYSSIYYPNSTVGSLQLDVITSLGLTKMDELGNFDSTFNYDYTTKKSFAGANGSVITSAQLYEGQIVLGGTFTTFHGKPASRLVCIDPATGLISNAFSGSTDGPVYKITYNVNTERLVITGNFKLYNGVAVNGVAVVKEDGSLDTDVLIKPMADGVPTYCAQLNDGRFIISGTFVKYDNIVRSGFAILNQDGTLAGGYNNTGLFRGRIYGHAEKDVFGATALYLVGNFDRFDNREVGNIVKIVLNNN